MIAPLSPVSDRNNPDAAGRGRPGHDRAGGDHPTVPATTRAGRRPGDQAWVGKGTATVPAYRVHRAKDLGYVRLDGRMVYLGRANTPESLAAYHRTVAEWLACGGVSGADRRKQGAAVAELVDAYLAYARGYYVDADGKPSSGLEPVTAAAALLKETYGAVPAAGFGPVALRGLRQIMVDRDLCRNVINQRICCIKRLFKWATADERVPPGVYQALSCVEPLRRGRSGARETDPVRPVPDAHVEAVLPFLPPILRAMVRLQRVTGMRSGELCSLRTNQVDRSGGVWTYRPQRHKTDYRGNRRLIVLGPRAQQILAPYLLPDQPNAFLFAPVRAMQERRAAREGAPPGSGPTRDGRVWRAFVGRSYTPRSFHRALRYGMRAAVKAGKLTTAEFWHPHQLRHRHATAVREARGLEAARVLLGHRSINQTLEYAQAEETMARSLALELG